MKADLDIATLVFVVSGMAMLTGYEKWGMYLILAAILIAILEDGAKRMHFEVNANKKE